MNLLMRWARKRFRHTRIVQSGSPPLYRLIAIGTILSASAQMIAGYPSESITEFTPMWFDIGFMVMTLASGVLILVGLYMIDESRYHAERLALSLSIERVGLAWLMGCIAVNMVAIVWFYGRPPTGIGSWWQIMFWVWGWTRLLDIRKALQSLTEE